jgi:hypothetical protein
VTNGLRAGLADLATAARPVDLRDRVHRGARRIARRNRALGAAAGVLLVTGSVAGLLTLAPAAGPAPQPADLSNATIAVPAYPGPWASACPQGEYTFADGIADVGPGARLVIADTPALRGDLDGVPGDETVIMLRCDTEGQSDGNPFVVRAEADGSVTSLGWVNVDADGELLVRDRAEPVEIVGGSIRVVVLHRSDSREHLEKQTRDYAYRDGRMVQLGGPTSFPTPTTDANTIDLRNTTLYVSTNDEVTNGFPDTYAGYVSISHGSGTAHLDKIIDGTTTGSVLVTVTVVQTLLVQTGERLTPVAVLEVTPADAPPRSLVMAYHHNELSGYAAREPWTVFTTAPGAPAPFVTKSPNQLTVSTDGGARTFQFNLDNATGPPWIEVAGG